jgi:hypothetical protein
MVKAHVLYLAFHIYLKQVSEVADETIRGHLELLARIFALDSLTKDCAAVFDSGYFGKGTNGLLA